MTANVESLEEEISALHKLLEQKQHLEHDNRGLNETIKDLKNTIEDRDDVIQKLNTEKQGMIRDQKIKESLLEEVSNRFTVAQTSLSLSGGDSFSEIRERVNEFKTKVLQDVKFMRQRVHEKIESEKIITELKDK